MRQYPIWNDVQACIYGSSKSWGAKMTAAVSVLVGSSSRNSHKFVAHATTHRQHDNGDKEFRFYVDGVCVKRAVLRKGAAGLEFLPALETESA